MRCLPFFLCLVLLSISLCCYAGIPVKSEKQEPLSNTDPTAIKPRVILVGGFLGSGYRYDKVK